MLNKSTPLSDHDLLRYARQILLDGWDIDAQVRLNNSRVLLIGAGGLGCPVAQTLVRAGLGHLHIVDDDLIELSNLPRQSLFFDEHLGKPKASTLANALSKHNPTCQITHHIARFSDNFLKNFTDLQAFDLIIDCTDNFASRDVINIASITCNIPLLSGSAVGQIGQVALFEPNKTACYHCLFDPNEQADDRRCADTGVLASTTAIIGNLQAQAALRFLGQGVNPIANTLLVWNGITMTLKHLKFHQNPDCPSCSKSDKLK